MSALGLLAADVSVAQNVGFGIIAAAMVFGALRVVTTNNVVHAALWLVIVLAGVAAQYILAAAEFVGRLAGARLHRRRDGAVPVRHHAHPGPARRASATSTTGTGARPSRWR